jgi:hypothetical protein
MKWMNGSWRPGAGPVSSSACKHPNWSAIARASTTGARARTTDSRAQWATLERPAVTGAGTADVTRASIPLPLAATGSVEV